MNIIGRLGQDPEVNFTGGGLAIMRASLAISERFKDKDGEWNEKTVWAEVKMFGKRGEAFARNHRKGSLAAFSGRLAYDEWDDRDTGKKRTKLYVIADSFEFVGDKPREDEGGGDPWGHDRKPSGRRGGERGTVRRRDGNSGNRGRERDEEPF